MMKPTSIPIARTVNEKEAVRLILADSERGSSGLLDGGHTGTAGGLPPSPGLKCRVQAWPRRPQPCAGRGSVPSPGFHRLA